MRTRGAGRSVLGTIAFFAATLLGVSSTARAQDLGIEIGSTAPAAKMLTLDGKDADLAQYIGRRC